MRIYISEDSGFPLDYLKRAFSRRGLVCDFIDNHKLCDIAFVRLGRRLDREWIKECRGLRYVVCPTTGHSHIDECALKEFKVTLISLRGKTEFLSTITPTAELALAMILSEYTRLHESSHSVYSKKVFDRNSFFRKSFSCMKIGIIGMGRLGKIVSSYIDSLGGEVRYYDPYVILPEEDEGSVVKCETLLSVFEQCEIVTVHCKEDEFTKGLITEEDLRWSRTRAVINTSRASILPVETIETALKEGYLERVYVDTIEEEPLESPDRYKASEMSRLQDIYGIDRIVVTPHIGGASASELERCEKHLIDQLTLLLVETSQV